MTNEDASLPTRIMFNTLSPARKNGIFRFPIDWASLVTQVFIRAHASIAKSHLPVFRCFFIRIHLLRDIRVQVCP